MAAASQVPPFRNLDIYRLAVIRRVKKQEIAASFGVSPSRISQVLGRVQQWVNDSVGHWFYPRRDELRFYVALEIEKIRLFESDEQPQEVVIEGLGWRYSRKNTTTDAGLGPHVGAHLAPHLSTHPLNSSAKVGADQSALSQSGAELFASPATLELGHRLAQLLTLWKKSKKVDSLRKSPAPAPIGYDMPATQPTSETGV
jgi:hypothetical protein